MLIVLFILSLFPPCVPAKPSEASVTRRTHLTMITSIASFVVYPHLYTLLSTVTTKVVPFAMLLGSCNSKVLYTPDTIILNVHRLLQGIFKGIDANGAVNKLALVN
jgi:hypothetical protein